MSARRRDLPAGVSPRGLAHEQAAAYCDLSVSTFDLQVARGLLPPALPFCAHRKVWDIKALDDALDRLSGRVSASVANDISQNPWDNI
jgi:hypothetical protein